MFWKKSVNLGALYSVRKRTVPTRQRAPSHAKRSARLNEAAIPAARLTATVQGSRIQKSQRDTGIKMRTTTIASGVSQPHPDSAEHSALHSVRNSFHSTVYDSDMIYSVTLTLDKSNQVQHVVEFPGADPDSQVGGYRTRFGNTRSNKVYIDCSLFIIQSETTYS
jgi:hypothetical protein